MYGSILISLLSEKSKSKRSANFSEIFPLFLVAVLVILTPCFNAIFSLELFLRLFI